MITICNACNDGQKVLGPGVDCKGCSASFCVDLDKREFTLAIDTNNQVNSHTSLSDKYATNQRSTTELVRRTKTPTCMCPECLSLDPLNSASKCGNFFLTFFQYCSCSANGHKIDFLMSHTSCFHLGNSISEMNLHIR